MHRRISVAVTSIPTLVAAQSPDYTSRQTEALLGKKSIADYQKPIWAAWAWLFRLPMPMLSMPLLRHATKKVVCTAPTTKAKAGPSKVDSQQVATTIKKFSAIQKTSTKSLRWIPICTTAPTVVKRLSRQVSATNTLTTTAFGLIPTTPTTG